VHKAFAVTCMPKSIWSFYSAEVFFLVNHSDSQKYVCMILRTILQCNAVGNVVCIPDRIGTIISND